MKFSLKSRLRTSREPCFGTWISSSSCVVLDAIKDLGFEWFMLDTEHSPLGPETMAAMISLLGNGGPAPLVRVGNIDQYLIKQALDCGAHGVLVPLVNTEAQARSVVAFAKYPPEGVRGAAASAASRYGRELASYLRTVNDELLVGVQIETKEALGNVGAIAAVDGVDLLFVGPQDLTLSLGLVDDRTNPAVLDAMRKIVDVAERHGKVPGSLVIDEHERDVAVELGFRFVSLASDIRFLLDGAKAHLGGRAMHG
jgi:2-keto-3-deoxy-L-rhamnonate aldolase RhmA